MLIPWPSPVPSSLLAIGGLLLASAASAAPAFNRDIRPILSENCFPCHGQDEKHRGGKLRLDLRDEALAPRDGGPAIVPGKPEASALMQRVTSKDPERVMPPPDSHLALLKPAQIALLEAWIADGATYQPHWAFVPPEKSPLPGDPAAHPVDAFVRAKLSAAGLRPSPPAEDASLVRRAFLDLTGLPPSPADLDTYLADRGANRWERLVDQLLASPHCAERLALPWLDAARYADTNGFSIDDHRDAWAWRDWVIHAFARNQPYDQFLTDQVAGDLIPGATPDQRAATAFLRNSMSTHEGGIIPEEYRVAYTIDKVDAVASTTLGLTMKCAQCHDHKFDPITQKEYYEFFAFFNTSSEPGMGGTNGNTAPLMDYTSPLAQGGMPGLRARIAELEYLQLHPTVPVVAARSAWEATRAAVPAGGAVPAADSAGFPWAQLDAAPPRWIWAGHAEPNQDAHFRFELSVDGPVPEAWIFTTCDDQADVSINSKPVAKVTLWSEPVLRRIELTRGANHIEVAARNNAGAGGFLALIAWRGENGWQTISTGEAWQARLTTTAEWQPAQVIGKHGAAPWGDVSVAARGEAERGGLAEAMALAADQRGAAHWRAVNEAFMASGDPLAERMRAVLASLQVEIEVLQRDLARGKTTLMVMDHHPELRKTNILIRGVYDQPGEEVTAGVPAILPPLHAGASPTRLDLARWITDARHPLTARVQVNRLWQMIFGRGLVESAGDFGNQGTYPTHPELLDWLAVDFTAHHWDLRHVLRTLLTSETYRQSAAITPAMLEKDPRNELLSRSPRTRLDAEFVRDAALAASGLIDLGIGGPSVHPLQPDGLWRDISHFGHPTVFTAQHFYPGRDASRHRRSLYTFWKRTSPPPALGLFDAPTRETCAQVRGQTNTPLQALVLLNDPQFVQAGLALGRRMLSAGGDSPAQHIAFGFRLVAGRAPARNEQIVLAAALARHQARYAQDPEAARSLLEMPAATAEHAAQLAAYGMLGCTLLNLDEAITRP
jgi:hypothetical protein